MECILSSTLPLLKWTIYKELGGETKNIDGVILLVVENRTGGFIDKREDGVTEMSERNGSHKKYINGRHIGTLELSL